MESMLIKVSIIIPVYNCGKYLERCLKSVFRQTLKDLEILCIDDGSTDESAQVIMYFQTMDVRIMLFQQENKGAGAARNLGLQKAQGKYVAFLDADDYYVDSSALEIMFLACEKQKVFLCGSRRIYMEGARSYFNEMYSPEETGKVLTYQDFQPDYFYQNYLIDRKMLEEQGIWFPDYRRYQDPPFFVRAGYCAKYFVIVDTCLYGYQMPEASTRYNAEKVCGLLRGIIDVLSFAREHKLNILFSNTVEHLEYEFTYMIYRNLPPDSLEILELLLEINHIVRSGLENPYFVIKPLRLLLFSSERYEEKLLKTIEGEEEIIIYGAGKVSRNFLRYLKSKGLLKKVKTLVVSELPGNDGQVEGVPVIPFKELKAEKECFLLVAVGKKMAMEIKTYLLKNGYANYEILEELFGDMLLQKYGAEEQEKIG